MNESPGCQGIQIVLRPQNALLLSPLSLSPSHSVSTLSLPLATLDTPSHSTRSFSTNSSSFLSPSLSLSPYLPTFLPPSLSHSQRSGSLALDTLKTMRIRNRKRCGLAGKNGTRLSDCLFLRNTHPLFLDTCTRHSSSLSCSLVARSATPHSPRRCFPATRPLFRCFSV